MHFSELQVTKYYFFIDLLVPRDNQGPRMRALSHESQHTAVCGLVGAEEWRQLSKHHPKLGIDGLYYLNTCLKQLSALGIQLLAPSSLFYCCLLPLACSGVWYRSVNHHISECCILYCYAGRQGIKKLITQKGNFHITIFRNNDTINCAYFIIVLSIADMSLFVFGHRGHARHLHHHIVRLSSWSYFGYFGLFMSQI